MHAIKLIELAASFVQHADACLRIGAPFRREATHAYWLTCRYRHDVWCMRLARHRDAIQKGDSSGRRREWYEIIPTIQEVMLSEPLTRCISHQAMLMEEHKVDLDFAALSQSAFTAHLEARNRCLHLIVFGAGLSPEQAAHLNRIRQHCEWFSDQLLGALRGLEVGEPYSFEPEKTRDSRQKLFASGLTDFVLKLHCSGLISGFLKKSALDLDYRQACPQEDSRVAETVLGLLPARAFDSLGIPWTIQASKLVGTNPAFLATDQAPETHSWPVQDNAKAKYFSPLDLLAQSCRPLLEDAATRRW